MPQCKRWRVVEILQTIITNEARYSNIVLHSTAISSRCNQEQCSTATRVASRITRFSVSSSRDSSFIHRWIEPSCSKLCDIFDAFSLIFLPRLRANSINVTFYHTRKATWKARDDRYIPRELRESCCDDKVHFSAQPRKCSSDAVFYPPSTERKARVRARGANEQLPSGKLPSRARMTRPIRQGRIHGTIFFLSSLALCFFQHSQRNSFAALGRHDWSTTRLRADEAASYSVSPIFPASHFARLDNSRCYMIRQFDYSICVSWNIIERKCHFLAHLPSRL